MTMQRKHIGILVGVLAVVAVVWLATSGRKVNAKQTGDDAARTVAVALVKRGPIVNSLTLSGAFRPYQQVDVHAKVAGFIRYIGQPAPVGGKTGRAFVKRSSEEGCALRSPSRSTQISNAVVGLISVRASSCPPESRCDLAANTEYSFDR